MKRVTFRGDSKTVKPQTLPQGPNIIWLKEVKPAIEDSYFGNQSKKTPLEQGMSKKD